MKKDLEKTIKERDTQLETLKKSTGDNEELGSRSKHFKQTIKRKMMIIRNK